MFYFVQEILEGTVVDCHVEDLTWVAFWDQQFLEFNKVLFNKPWASKITLWTSLRTVDLKRQRVSDSFSHIIKKRLFLKKWTMNYTDDSM